MKTKNKPKNEFFIRSVDYGVEEDTRTIKGVIPYNSDSVDMNGITEKITPTAFNKTLADKTEVKCLLGHDVTKILGSSRAGTLRMTSEKDGLHFEVDLPNTTDGNDAYELIQRGDCTTLSFGFIPVKVRSSVVDGHEVDELVEVILFEISVCVAFPAYPEGNTSVRSFFEKCGTDFEEVEKSNWGYNYVAGQGTQENTQSIWANAKTNDGSMFVWIPRYAYKITYYDTDGTTVLGYSNADGIVDVDGNVIQENGTGIQTVGDYIVHPAFTSNAAIGGGFNDGSGKGVTGLWVGKFETTGTADNPTVKPGVTTLRSQNINAQYQTGKSATFGETVTINSHMAKNSEWGAVAYLAHSQYGTNGKKVAKNTQNYTTSGGTSTISTIYTTYVNNSTTHNAYGIYDLNGGAWENVASYVNNGGTYLSTNGGTTAGDLYGATDYERATSTAYKTVYSGNGTQATDYATSASMKGDAVYETSNSLSSARGSWFAAYSIFPSSGYPFFYRGGRYINSYAGTFCFDFSNGGESGDSGFHVCLAF